MRKQAHTKKRRIQRVLVIGLDGATLDLIKPWAKAGLLPTFKELFERGAYGVMESTIPVHSTPAWTSVVTGKSPCKHGVWYPMELSGGKIKIKSSSDLKCDTIWEILNRYGKKAIVVNVPLTYPPQKINGIIVTGMETPDLDADISYPKEIKNILLEKNYEIDLSNDEHYISFYSDKKKLFIRMSNIEEKRVNVILHLLKNYEWDFSIVVLNLLDRCQHTFWQFLDHEQPIESNHEENFILKAHQEICRSLDKLISNFLDERTMIVLVSDHGFGPMNKWFYINNWLKEQGFLRTKKNLSTWVRLKVRAVAKLLLKNPSTANVLMLLLRMSKTLSRLRTPTDKVPPQDRSFEDIDFARTKVYSPYTGFGGYGFLKINVESRNLRDAVIGKLYNVIDPENGRKIVKKVYKKEEIFGKELAFEAPDLVIETERGYVCHYPIPSGHGLFKDTRGTPWNGNHEKNGIFFVFGPNIKKNFEMKRLTVTDVTPTILYMFGLPIPIDMDGQVLIDCFKSRYLKSNPIRYSKEPSRVIRPAKDVYSKEEEEKVKDRLRALGYL